eukprot:1257768-Prymnesium_polylepis.1
MQARMSIEQRGDFSIHSLELTIIFILCTFGALACAFVVFMLQLWNISSLQARRLLHLEKGEEVPVNKTYVRSPKQLEKMLEGSLFKKDARGRIVEDAKPLPTAGPFHCFLSHNWKHGQEKMRVVKSRLEQMLPEVSVFLEYLCWDSNRGLSPMCCSRLTGVRIPVRAVWTILAADPITSTLTSRSIVSASAPITGSPTAPACARLSAQFCARSHSSRCLSPIPPRCTAVSPKTSAARSFAGRRSSSVQ